MVKNSVFGGQKRTILGSFPMGYTGNGHFDTPFWDLIFSDRDLRGASLNSITNLLFIHVFHTTRNSATWGAVFF